MMTPGDRESMAAGESGGQNDLAGLHQAGGRLWPDHGPHSLPPAGPPPLPADLCLAGLRSVAEISGAAALPRLLVLLPGGPAPFGDRCAFPADQARRTACGGRRVPPALRRTAACVAALG